MQGLVPVLLMGVGLGLLVIARTLTPLSRAVAPPALLNGRAAAPARAEAAGCVPPARTTLDPELRALNRPLAEDADASSSSDPPKWSFPKCSLIVLRHIPKTGGTTLKNLFNRLELAGHFEAHTIDRKRCHSWKDAGEHTCAGRALDGLSLVQSFEREVVSGSLRLPRRIFLELHVEDGFLDVVTAVLDAIDRLRPHAERLGCRVVTALVVRDPYTYYPSLYRYSGVHECHGCSLEQFVAQHANAQTRSLLAQRRGSPEDAAVSRMFDRPLNDALRELSLPSAHSPSSHPVSALAAASVSLVRRALGSLIGRFDLVAPMERFNELVVELCALAAISPCPAYRTANTARIWQHKLVAHGVVTNASAWRPEQDACALRAVQMHNGLDLELHANVSASFSRRTAVGSAAYVARVRTYIDGRRHSPPSRFCWRGGAAPFPRNAVVIGAPFPRQSAKRARFHYTHWLLFRQGELEDGLNVCRDRDVSRSSAGHVGLRRRRRSA